MIFIMSHTYSSFFKMNDLRKHKLLGKGSFGKVWLVSKKGENTPYALKVMIKQRIHKKGQVSIISSKKIINRYAQTLYLSFTLSQSQFVINERRIMVQLAHPFIVKLYSAFQDDVSLYMLINLIQGGEVYNLLQAQENKRLQNNSACFYSACVINALVYIHSKNIIHRDIKAENIMVDNEGYCSIIDFGFGKVKLYILIIFYKCSQLLTLIALQQK